MIRWLPGVFCLLAACGSTGYMRPAAPTAPPGPGESKVVVYQLVRMSQTSPLPLYEFAHEDGKLLGFSDKDGYFEYRCAPGKHVFYTWGEATSYIEAELAPGLTYFVRAFADPGLFSVRVGFTPVSPETPEMRKLDQAWPRLQCRELDPEKASEYASRREDRIQGYQKSYEEGMKDPQFLRTQDGRPGVPGTTR